MLLSLNRMPTDLSSDARRQLLNAVTDLFLLDDEPSDESKTHYGEIAVRSLSTLGGEARKDYADQVAAVPSLPRQVANVLAGDADSEVARLVLKLSPVLTDSDLAAIAVSQSQKHLVAIAERACLPEAVTDILVERGDRTVLYTVSGNEGASFSDTGFDRLIERSEGDVEIHRTLAVRSDLSPSRASRVLRVVEELTDETGLWTKPDSEEVTLARKARQQRLEIKLLLVDLQAGKRDLDAVLIMLAEEDRAYHLAQVLAQAASLTTEQSLRVLMQRDASGIAVACKAIGVGADAFRAIATLRGLRLRAIKQTPDDAVIEYGKLEVAMAERTLRFLKMKTSLS